MAMCPSKSRPGDRVKSHQKGVSCAKVADILGSSSLIHGHFYKTVSRDCRAPYTQEQREQGLPLASAHELEENSPYPNPEDMYTPGLTITSMLMT